jgi:hypothetical protein
LPKEKAAIYQQLVPVCFLVSGQTTLDLNSLFTRSGHLGLTPLDISKL